VALIARGTESLQGAQEEIEREGGKALTVSADVADAKSIFEAADVVAKQWRWDHWLIAQFLCSLPTAEQNSQFVGSPMR
jgi:NADP-dependent 3-hydroxy acid dehydrogenase YdfG